MDKQEKKIDEEDIDRSLKVSPRKQCPTYCSLFKCTVSENLHGKCREECGKLDLTKSLICELCGRNKECSKEQKMIFLDTKYFDYMNTLLNQDTKDKVNEIKSEYRAMEIQLQAVRDDFYKTPTYNVGVRNNLKEKSGKLKARLSIYAEVMEKLGIAFDKNVDIDT